ncbi:MAG: amino acid transporter permease [Rhizobium sp.]|nr:amino acid transporter permease [Rhizobium sp.]
MLDRILEEAPRFFTYYNMIFVLKAMGTTLLLTAVGCITGFVVGFAIASLRATKMMALMPFRILITIYVEIFRRIPFLVTLFIVMFAIQVISRDISLFVIATISICMLSTAFLSEIIRAGMESVPRQQVEAAETLNFGFWRTQLRVVLPQSWKVIIPPAFAFMVMFIKDTSLASQMGVIELTFTGKSLMNRGFSPFLVYGMVLASYFAMSYPLSRLGAYMEKRLASS